MLVIKSPEALVAKVVVRCVLDHLPIGNFFKGVKPKFRVTLAFQDWKWQIEHPLFPKKIVNFQYFFSICIPKQPNKDFLKIYFMEQMKIPLQREERHTTKQGFKLWFFLHPSLHRSQSLPLLTLTCPFLFYVLKGITYYQAKIITRDLCDGALWVSTLMSSISSLETTKWSSLVFPNKV
jgi:hypothetical protein